MQNFTPKKKVNKKRARQKYTIPVITLNFKCQLGDSFYFVSMLHIFYWLINYLTKIDENLVIIIIDLNLVKFFGQINSYESYNLTAKSTKIQILEQPIW